MVTKNYSDLTDEFGDASVDRDLLTVFSAGFVGAGGGIVAADLAARVVQVFWGTQNPSSVAGRLASGGTKMTVGMLLAFLGSAARSADREIIGYVLQGGGLGASVVGGADIWSVILDANLLGSALRAPSRALPSPGRSRQVRRAHPSGSSSGSAQATAQTGQVAAANAGQPSPNTQANPEQTTAYRGSASAAGPGAPTAYN